MKAFISGDGKGMLAANALQEPGMLVIPHPSLSPLWFETESMTPRTIRFVLLSTHSLGMDHGQSEILPYLMIPLPWLAPLCHLDLARAVIGVVVDVALVLLSSFFPAFGHYLFTCEAVPPTLWAVCPTLKALLGLCIGDLRMGGAAFSA